MNSTIASLTKLARALTDRVDELERENTGLYQTNRALLKGASASRDAAPAVSGQVVDETLRALLKSGSLREDQLQESRQILLRDAEAPHRVLQKLLYAQCQTKKAACDDGGDNLTGGRIAGGAGPGKDAQADCLERMMSLLNM